MSRKDSVSDESRQIVIEKNVRSTWIQRIGKILCLFVPIASAFAGYFLAYPLWNLFSENGAAVPETFRFITSLVLFAVTTTVVFFKTRNTNPIMRIRVFNKENKGNQL